MKNRVLKIILCLISILIIIPSNVKAMNSASVQNNDNGLYILVNGRNRLQNQNVTTISEYQDSEKVGVEKTDICDNDLNNFITKYWGIVVALAPALLILMTSIDFFKAIVSGDADKIKKSSSDALKRTLAFILLLFLPFIVNTLFSWIGIKLCLGNVKFN